MGEQEVVQGACALRATFRVSDLCYCMILQVLHPLGHGAYDAIRILGVGKSRSKNLEEAYEI